jgi:predicted nucleotidyltransferase
MTAPRASTVRKGKAPDERVIHDIVRRIVEAVAPEEIILFGSAARGEMGPDSDLDFLVVKAGVHRRKTAQAIGRHLIGVAPGIPKDIVVVTPEDIERYRDTIGFIIRPALREGRVVYAA